MAWWESLLRAADQQASVEETLKLALDQVCAFARLPLGHVYLAPAGGRGVLKSTGLWFDAAPARHEATASRVQPVRRVRRVFRDSKASPFAVVCAGGKYKSQ